MKNITTRVRKSLHLLAVCALSSAMFSSLLSCENLLTPSSDLVEFEDDNKLNSTQDTLYSVMGIIHQMQKIADRTVLLGEVRADLVSPTDQATTSIKELAACDVSDKNTYNDVADYYSVINNCNYFIENADTNLHKLGVQVFEKEYAAVKTYRAWTYLQLAKNYGKVPLVLKPITTISQAELEQQKDYADMNRICNTFIEDIKPYVDTYLPDYKVSTSSGTVLANAQKFFIPVRVLLGEMCLWTGRYEEAAQYFYDYLTFRNKCVSTGTGGVYWGSNIKDAMAQGSCSPWSSDFLSSITSPNDSEILCYIPMEKSEFNGVISRIADVYQSTENNKYYAQVTPSKAVKQLSGSQKYCQVNTITATQKDTVVLERSDYQNITREEYYGDLRLSSCYEYRYIGQSVTSHYSADRYNIKKISSSMIPLYRVQQVYLMFAEALNRAGYPETAFAILKYGLCQYNLAGKMNYLSEREMQRAARFLGFNENTDASNNFDQYNTKGIHARGCGDAYANPQYTLPMPETELATFEDTIQYQIPLVENYILDEMALEQAFEGARYYNLMRIALRRGDNSILALPISQRTGIKDETLYNRLMDQKNWYLPLPGDK